MNELSSRKLLQINPRRASASRNLQRLPPKKNTGGFLHSIEPDGLSRPAADALRDFDNMSSMRPIRRIFDIRSCHIFKQLTPWQGRHAACNRLMV
jgi:hypothetical protein